MYEIYLPSDKKQREQVLNELISAGERLRHIHEIGWFISHHYLQGAREFTNVNYATGTLDINYVNEDGALRFRYDDIVSKFQAQVGRLMQIDLGPKVERKGIGLEGLRKSSIAQVALDDAFPPAKVEELKLSLAPTLTKYGCVGLAVWNEGEDMGIDVVAPWELIPIPPNPIEDTDLRGICRSRMVPIDWLKKQMAALPEGPKAGNEVWEAMDKIQVTTGNIPTESGNMTSTVNLNADGQSDPRFKTYGTKPPKTNQTKIDVVKMVEIWTKTAAGYLQDYTVMAGRKLLYTKKYAPAIKMYMPLVLCHDIKTGGMWGRSFVSTQIPFNTEMEYSLGRLFQNIQDIDLYGILCLPTTMGIPASMHRSSDGTKRLMFEPDLGTPELKPFNIPPFNSGTMPVEAIKVASSLADKIANQPTDMMAGNAPGRVDSQTGLGFLFEVSNVPLRGTAAAIAIAVSNCYRVMLSLMPIAWGDKKLVDITLLDDSLAGIKMDSTDGTMSLADNMIPHPDEVVVTIESILPKSKEQEKMEMKEALKMGSINMFEYRMEVRKRGLELPVGNEAEWQNYRRAMMENLVLFGDGQKPGSVIVDDNDMGRVHLAVLQPFMARPEFFQASAEVQNAFKEHYKRHMEQIGTYPEGVPTPEGAAEQTANSAQSTDVMAQLEGMLGGGGGGMPPQGAAPGPPNPPPGPPQVG